LQEEIFEHYSNQISLGMRGSFSIRGFGQASQAYFERTSATSLFMRLPRLPLFPETPLTTILTAIPITPSSGAT
jgi:hypothetical protein